MLGTIQAAEALKYVTNTGELLTNRLLTFDAKSMVFNIIKIKPNKNCISCSENPQIKQLVEYKQDYCTLK